MESSSTRRFVIDGVVAPGLTLLACLWLYRHLVGPEVDLEAMTRGRFGPAAWPRFMLAAIMLCCVLQFARLLWRWLGHRRSAALTAAGVEVGSAEERHIVVNAPQAVPPPDEDPIVATVAIGLIVAYGYLFELAGFVLSTLVFFVAWLLLGGFRKRPLALLLVTVLGTLFNVFLFVKLAGMPLERGHYFFDDITVAIYRVLKIY